MLVFQIKLKYHYSKSIKLQNFPIIKNTAPIRLRSHLHPCERGRVQNGALSTLWVQKLSFVHFAPSADAVFAKGAQQEVMGMRRSWLWVKLPQNQWKTRVQRDPAMPGFWRGYLKKVVFSLLPSEYRTRAPSVRTPSFSLVILVFIDLCRQILVSTTSMCIWVSSLKMGALCFFLGVWKSCARFFSWQQIRAERIFRRSLT